MKGYTLIEILVVLFIVSIVAGVALLTIGRNQNKQMETFVSELTQSITLAEERAMLQPTVLGLSIGTSSLQFNAYQPALAKEKSKWLPVQDTALSQRTIPNDIQLGLNVGQARGEFSNSNGPQIIISTNGDLTPFTIYVGKKGQKPRYAITGDADGNVTSRELS